MTADASIALRALQQPEWPDAQLLRQICEKLAGETQPVDVRSCQALSAELATVAAGDGFVVTGGECAEVFGDAAPARIVTKAEHLGRLADELTRATGLGTTRIGRFGGQFAKPRSNPYEELPDGRRVPSYRGDAVNGFPVEQRRPDPYRLLTAHGHSVDAVRALRSRDRRRQQEASRQRRQPPPATYVGHEALLLDYERALLRHEGRHASSGHYLWVGERTRQLDSAHVDLLAGIDNPIGVKLGPSVEPDDVRALVDRLDPAHRHRAGRLSLIVRMGAARCAKVLPSVVEALGERAHDVLWILDPMHGNGRVNVHGQKTRLLSEMKEELGVFFVVLLRHRLRPAGIHLEMTPDEVTECVEDEAGLTQRLPAYETACDPRLNPSQASNVVEMVAELLQSRPGTRSRGVARHRRHRAGRTAARPTTRLHAPRGRTPAKTPIETLLEQHDTTRRDALNLIVSENRMTPRALAPLNSDIQSRYAASFYAGTSAAREIVGEATDAASSVFGASHVNLAPVSGNMCLLAVVFGLTETGDLVGRVPPFFPGGGYPFNYEVFDRRPLPLPFSEADWQLDLPRTVELLQKHKPPLVVLGSSIVTYPMPVREVADVVHGYGGLVAYDGSHSLGLIAGGQYQDPLREGADVLFGSTHKTFPGPQGGIILSNNRAVHKRVELLANFRPLNGPTLVCNPHLARIASTGIVLQETRWEDYARQVVANARTLAEGLRDRGVPLHGATATTYPELTYCHQVITGYERSDSARLRNHLASHRINADAFLRFGTSEITRLGFQEAQSKELADIVAHLLQHEKEETTAIDERIGRLIEAHRTVVL